MVKMEPNTGQSYMHAFKSGPNKASSMKDQHPHGGSRQRSAAQDLDHRHHGNRPTSSYIESASFDNIYIEYEENNREMGVDVPDSFVAQTKTPPKYPPPSLGVEREDQARSSGSSFSQLSISNGHSNRRSFPEPPPSRPSRDHIRIEKDGQLFNTMEPPPLIRDQQPTPEQSQRIKRYGEDIARRAAEQERRSTQNEILRHSLRNSQKLRALKENGIGRNREGKANFGYSKTGEDVEDEFMLSRLTSSDLLASIERLASDPSMQTLARRDVRTDDAIKSLRTLINDQRFQKSFQFAQKIEDTLSSKSTTSNPLTIEAQESASEALSVLAKLEGDEDDTAELANILTKPWLEHLLSAHDKIGALKTINQHEENTILDRIGAYRDTYSEPNIQVVVIEKSTEPLGATVKNDGESVIIARIIRGGTADASGLLHEGDEILEVNNIELRGKEVNEVCEILSEMNNVTLTFLVVPSRQHHIDSFSNVTGREHGGGTGRQKVVHLKAHIDYDPEDDMYVPCRDLGIGFVKGDILHVINQKDPNWWQAKREGESDQQLAGLIPSNTFLAQREAMKHTIAQDEGGHGGRSLGGHSGGFRRAKSGFLCAKGKSGRKNKKHLPYAPEDEVDAEDVVTYEEVALYYPRADRKRPVVLIGPPNIGRHELRQRLMQDTNRFAAAIPHTSRPQRADEVNGQDYHFITRQQFEQDILARRFVEHGEYEKSYYGTSIEAIRSVVHLEKICVLNLHPQSLKILKNSDLMPYVVFVAPPSLEKLKRWKIDHSEPINDDELRDIIERAREMEETFGHYFDDVIIYSDPERAYQQLMAGINGLEREPQWVPAAWLTGKADTM